jgi:hypothetical protein
VAESTRSPNKPTIKQFKFRLLGTLLISRRANIYSAISLETHLHDDITLSAAKVPELSPSSTIVRVHFAGPELPQCLGTRLIRPKTQGLCAKQLDGLIGVCN